MTSAILSKIKHQCTCSDCGHTFFLEDADWCEHKINLGLGTKECPSCGECICNGNTIEEIQQRFEDNIKNGKFVQVKSNPFGWEYMCKTVKEVQIP